MPETVPEVLYWALMGMSTMVLSILTMVVTYYLYSINKTTNETRQEISGLRSEIGKEREDRITLYGILRGELSAHVAACLERHRRMR